MSVYEHVLPIPTEDELHQLIGAATPHFAFQTRDRVAQYAAALPPDHARQAEFARYLDYLDHLGYDGETGGATTLDLPPRVSVPGLLPEG